MVGRRVVAALQSAGHETRALSRHSTRCPIDLRTGSGLDGALSGCDVVVDASNGPPSGKARTVLVDGCRRLLEAERRAGVAHHVCVSIIGIDSVPMGYYRVKVEQEREVEMGGVPWTIVRATQFHDLLGGALTATARWHVLPGGRAQFQPVDVEEAASAIAAAATGGARRERLTVAGPEVHDLSGLARLWREGTGRRALSLPVPLPGKLGRALREGRLTCATPDVRGRRTFADWLGNGR